MDTGFIYDSHTGKVHRPNGTIVEGSNGINNDGSRNVYVVGGSMGSGGTPEAITFMDSVTSTTTSSYTVNNKSKITLEIYGTATSATVNFKAVGPSGTSRAMSGVRISDFGVATSGTLGEIWQFDVTGLTSFIVEVASISGGNVSVKGTVV
ncbi:hypothetical protein G5B47_02480 [Paenibacillus sp. 7124]|uniref:Uncharacterized protein n=1 Tax=Paenibacillus apii TaxID=1850370 RepID=A0A6M1PGA2_9BACL|nr:hypothetical protein [Paenibacillus apii]NGM81275.1 hypothetical protein [Paenibacillus apii]